MEITLDLAAIKKLEKGQKLVFGDVTVSFYEPAPMASGADITEFYKSDWKAIFGASSYHEFEDGSNQVQDEEGEYILQPDRMYDLTEFGPVVALGSSMDKGVNIPFDKAFATWKIRQS